MFKNFTFSSDFYLPCLKIFYTISDSLIYFLHFFKGATVKKLRLFFILSSFLFCSMHAMQVGLPVQDVDAMITHLRRQKGQILRWIDQEEQVRYSLLQKLEKYREKFRKEKKCVDCLKRTNKCFGYTGLIGAGIFVVVWAGFSFLGLPLFFN